VSDKGMRCLRTCICLGGGQPLWQAATTCFPLLQTCSWPVRSESPRRALRAHRLRLGLWRRMLHGKSTP
jgi:hypothetical protein